jgi:mono/diheme cytochrome c family protein
VTPTLLVVGILLLGAVIAALMLWRSARGRRQALQDVPPAMRPAYSDEELEQTVAYRYRAWGMVLFAFFALFLPVYWFFEAGRLNDETEGFFVQSVVRGESLYVENCSECHGPEGQGGAAASPYGEGSWPAPNLTNIAARYEENPNITDIRDYIVTTLERGRPGTPMPTWGAAYGGPLTDQQISEITDWILANQTGQAEEVAAVETSGEELFLNNCAKCHGENANGLFEGEGETMNRPGPSLIGVFERHDPATVLGILRNGIYLGTGVSMPPWQTGYMYPEARFDDASLEAIVEYLQSIQPAQLPEGAEQYQTPGSGPPGAPAEETEATTALRDEARG